ncbi:MAG: RagB/SusD family nutrient uptake outer membrane protein [Chitinophagales bacterium]|nr:RagB/SusD family nutrient uptake outer membrane protein [Chitinophagales bacterium]
MRQLLTYFLKTGLFLLTLLPLGCNSFLDKVPQGNLTQQNFPENADEALLATNAVYNTLRNWYFNSGGYPILDIMSDDANKGSNPSDQASTIGPYDNFTITTSQDGLDRWWNALYEGIKRANVVIEKVPAIQMDEGLKNRYIAEAKFLRALYYFDLVRAWGGVPLITSITPPLTLARSSREETYSLIEADLLFAIDHLFDKTQYSPPDIGRATKGSAQSMLAKVYMFENDFTNAVNYSQAVINSGLYSLDPDFSHIFSIEGQFNNESVFEVGAIGQEGPEKGGNQYANTQGVRGSPNLGWGFNRPSIDLMNSFSPDDPRKDATIIFLNEVLDGITILGDGSTPDVTYTDQTQTTVKEIECYNQKVFVPSSGTTATWGDNRKLIRYADVLLMAAEALNETGNSSQALTYLNEVRARARGSNTSNLPDITETNKDLLRDIIINERRYELAMEGHRFWDLVRTNKAAQVLGNLGFMAGKNELFPIPQIEIDISQGTLEQNPGW